ncbi:reverse transcriptase [Cucumis melo var. makuwa]|uniref:Reverse transcriptase n=1 Tax=Cucumis melo var. makuwa TaxID=1194695 RepID=A0A5A7UMX8_CUCMM|nr:reverse transcriptase [Cucumis melo var. makuwa]TYK18750.1 reverse transcriptase [Cucumis melo var. makuwa]
MPRILLKERGAFGNADKVVHDCRQLVPLPVISRRKVSRRYTVSEKEMLAVVQRQYLLGSSFVVKTDNSATCHFFTQPKLTSKQARWQEFLAEIDFEFEHKKGSSNHAADVLSRKQEHAAICLLAHLQASEIDGSVRDTLREFLQKDHAPQTVMNLAKAGKTRQFWVEENLLVIKGNPEWQRQIRSYSFLEQGT